MSHQTNDATVDHDLHLKEIANHQVFGMLNELKARLMTLSPENVKEQKTLLLIQMKDLLDLMDTIELSKTDIDCEPVRLRPEEYPVGYEKVLDDMGIPSYNRRYERFVNLDFTAPLQPHYINDRNFTGSTSGTSRRSAFTPSHSHSYSHLHTF